MASVTRPYKPLVFVSLLAILGTAVVIVASGAAGLPIREWFESGIAWIEAHRTLAWAVYIAAYAVGNVLLIPATLPTLVGGFMFGFPLGVVPASAGSVLGAAGAFLVGRFFARDWVKRCTERLPRFAALDSAVRSDGFTIVLLSRLSPFFPFFLLNYAFGVTAVRFRDYILATWIGLLPPLVLYVYFGSLAQDLLALTEGDFDRGPFGLVLAVGGLIATALLVVVITRKASRVLGAHLERESENGIGAAGAGAAEAADKVDRGQVP